MTAVSFQPFTGTFRATPVSSTIAFAVRHSGVFWYRGTLSGVDGTMTAEGGELRLEGTARVDAVSVQEPAELRAHLLSADFFDAERHPEISFRSSAVRLGENERAEVDGSLTIRGVTRPITATGSWAPPREAPFGEVAGLQLHAQLDRRDFGFDWQAPMPSGGDLLGWDVEVSIDLLLIREQDAPTAA